ncbi:hypothetical protein GQ53DRAFT_743015 [Thozetella sp. PMI_491]|nr:hypothetical protein GQ53DRAFT_743015 [Thozetella sp. PMI_491]
MDCSGPNGTIELPSRVEIAPALEPCQPSIASEPEIICPEPEQPKDLPARRGGQPDPIFGAPPGYHTFVPHWGRYRAQRPTRMLNSLLASVGFLEAANAGDFAANVWNDVPVPTHARVLMAVGGSIALGMIYFAVKDALLSWQNIQGLRRERRYLKSRRTHHSNDTEIIRTIDCLLNVNYRELGTEWIDRIGLDTFMGFGALMIGIGTILAIFGSDPNIFAASNLLSGYVGNVPCSAYGLANLGWSIYVWRRARRHDAAGSKSRTCDKTAKRLKARTYTVRLHGALNGTAGAVAGVASLITATMWWGYVLLVPCIVAAAVSNFLWRHRVGYTRPFVRKVVPFSEDILEAELAHVDSCQQHVQDSPPSSGSALFARLVSDPTSLNSVLEFLQRNELLEEFCLHVMADRDLRAALGDFQGKAVTIDMQRLAAAEDGPRSRLISISEALVVDSARKCFLEQERYLLELMGCYLCSAAAGRSRA